MLSRSSWLHLRIPFSYFLLPIFLFALAVSPNITPKPLLWTFVILHFLLYPASNGYNSYFDKDEKSIGGLRNPPPVNKGLYYLSLMCDVFAVILGFIFVNLSFSVMLIIYGLVSKAYSHPGIRLKKYAITSWLITGLFQGLFTMVMCYVGINNFTLINSLHAYILIPGMLSCLMLWANYPMTQIYQYEEDGKRGDVTLSMRLGIRGTFYFTGIIFGLVTLCFIAYFNAFYGAHHSFAFIIAIMPIIIYFFYWFTKVYNNESYANYTYTMILNFLSATCLNIFFIYFFLKSTNILQAFNN